MFHKFLLFLLFQFVIFSLFMFILYWNKQLNRCKHFCMPGYNWRKNNIINIVFGRPGDLLTPCSPYTQANLAYRIIQPLLVMIVKWLITLVLLTARLHIQYPMLFKLTNNRAHRVTHCGVLEFVADEGRVYLPYWVIACFSYWICFLLTIKPGFHYPSWRPVNSVAFFDTRQLGCQKMHPSYQAVNSAHELG